jgi:serine/threonine protein kinase
VGHRDGRDGRDSSVAGCLREQQVIAFLDGEMAPDEARHVEEHIDECAECRVLLAEVGRSLEPPVAASPEPAADGEPGERRSLVRGDSVGRYRLLGPLGSGSMGVVYAAYDPELGRRIALKLVRPQSPDRAPTGERTRARVLREAQAMARLAHPNVVAIHDVGTFGDEVFLAMELVEGTLASVVDRQRAASGWQGVLSLFLQAGEGLAAAHDGAIVHRDFKPENVLVGRDGRPRVCDFGLARAPAPMPPDALPGEDFSAETAATTTRGLLGTPAYMAPEQLRGEHAGPPADVFAFAVALYEALYGHRPFRGGSVRELRLAIESGRPQAPPPGRPLPRPVREAILRALAVDPKERPTMRELLAELRDLERGAARPAPLSRTAVLVAAAGALGLAFLALRPSSAPSTSASPRAAEPPVAVAAATRPTPPSSGASLVGAPPEAPPPPPPASSRVAQAAVRSPGPRRRDLPPTASASAEPSAPASAVPASAPPRSSARPLFDDPY